MRLEVEPLASSVRGEEDTKGISRGVRVEPTLDFLAASTTREAVNHLDTLVSAVGAFDRLLENGLQVPLCTLSVLGKNKDTPIVPPRRLSPGRRAEYRLPRTEVFADPIDKSSKFCIR